MNDVWETVRRAWREIDLPKMLAEWRDEAVARRERDRVAYANAPRWSVADEG